MTSIGTTDKRGYTTVEPTPCEVAKFMAKRGYAPTVGMVQCGNCGKRIWNSGFGRGSHDRSKACKSGSVAQRPHRAYRRNDTIECRCAEFGRDHVATLDIYGERPTLSRAR